MGMVINFLTGAGVKVIASAIWKMMELKRQKELASLNAETDKIMKLQGGEDKADPWTRMTRRIIALALVGTWCYILLHSTVFHPGTEYTIMIDKSPSIFFGWLFDTTNKTTLHISAGSLLWDFKGMIEILIGFYFTKIGK